MYDAVAVAIVTGTSVRALTSWSMISMANSTPPIGVLNVAAMPAPAPAAISVIRCHTGTRSNWASVEAKRSADLHDRPLAANRASATDRQRRGQRLDRARQQGGSPPCGSKSRP